MQQIDREQGLRVYIPSGKHISPLVLGVLDDRHLQYELKHNGALHGDAQNAELSLILINHRDILGRVGASGSTGFVGSDRFDDYRIRQERGEIDSNGNPLPKLEELYRLDLFPNRLRVSLIVSDVREGETSREIETVADLAGKTVVTSYLGLGAKFFSEKKVPDVKLDPMSGHEEGMVRGGEAAGAIVVVDTGETVKRNNCIELEVLRRNLCVLLVYNPKFFMDSNNKELVQEFIEGLIHGFPTNQVELRKASFVSRIKEQLVNFGLIIS